MSLAAQSLANAAQLHQGGRLREAVEVYKFALSQARSAEDRARVLHMMGIALAQQGKVEDGLSRLREAVDADPAQTGFREELALMLSRFGRHEEAVESLREAIRVRPSAANARVHLGNELVTLRRVDEAKRMFAEAVEREPRNAAALHALGFMAERFGEFTEAAQLATRALQANPRHIEAGILLARAARRKGDLPTARAILERMLSSGMQLSAREAGRALVELGFVLDAQGDEARATEAFIQGKRALFSLMGAQARDKNLATLTIDRCRRIVAAERVAAWAPPPADALAAPVFLVGYPRSGTTLVEQMLAAHPSFVTTGEDPILYRVKAQIPSLIGAEREYPDALDALTPDQLTRLRAMYWEEAASVMGDALRGKRLVEKHPLVLVDLPLVRRLFPESKVIVVLRDPRDAVLSCFMQDFDRGTPHFYDLGWTAEHYDLVMDLWAHYKTALPGLVYHELKYEELCAEPEPHARRLLEFLGERWDDRVLKFFEPDKRRYVTTPSYADVQKPVYTASVGRWRRYQGALAPVLPRLERHIREMGYDAQ